MAKLFDELTSSSLQDLDLSVQKNFFLSVIQLEQAIVNMAIDLLEKKVENDVVAKLIDPFTKLTIGKTTDVEVEGSTTIVRQKLADIAAQVKFNFIAAGFRTITGENVTTFGRSKVRMVFQGGFDVSQVGALTQQLVEEGDIDGLIKLAKATQNAEFKIIAPPETPPLESPTEGSTE